MRARWDAQGAASHLLILVHGFKVNYKQSVLLAQEQQERFPETTIVLVSWPTYEKGIHYVWAQSNVEPTAQAIAPLLDGLTHMVGDTLPVSDSL